MVYFSYYYILLQKSFFNKKNEFIKTNSRNKRPISSLIQSCISIIGFTILVIIFFIINIIIIKYFKDNF